MTPVRFDCEIAPPRPTLECVGTFGYSLFVSPQLYLIVGIIGGGVLVAIVFLLTRRGPGADGTLFTKIELLERVQEREERMLREEMARGRQENANAAKVQREELRAALMTFTETFATQTGKLTESNEQRLESLRSIVDLRLKQLQEDNSKQIDKMRATVDEKLQGTLEKRLGESFKLVSDRLEQVHQGLGAMRQLASDVGGLQKVLANVKTRGGWGEVQLGSLLEQVLTPDQFARNVKTREESGEYVEFAIKLPGDENGAPVWLPIDAKFPTEDYQRLVAAQEQGDLVAVDDAMRSLETQLKRSAKDICQKYINPPRTTDFALMFLPTEGLYAEAIRRVGLVEQVQRDCRVIFAGPTTLAALLNSLQMGFRTLAIQKRSSEVWNLLSTVKNEFGKFGEALSAVKDKLDQAARHVDSVAVRSRAITKKLRDVEELPSNPQPLLKDLLGGSEDEEG
jgi:DNA recombination protein RmuC